MPYISFVDGDQVSSLKFNDNFNSTLDLIKDLKTRLTGLSQQTLPFEWSTVAGSSLELKCRFIAPDDLEIYVVGAEVERQVAEGVSIDYTVEINGTTTDFENDLPETPHLFLTESIDGIVSKADISDESNVLKIAMPAGVTVGNSSRYVGRRYCITDPTIDGTLRKPLNMILKGASYDVTIRRSGVPALALNAADYVYVYFMYEAKRRRT
tara:strand:+ start:125 stop:754 length:630 start_codon:yes stop_codon:yes gene_type:complete